MRVNPLETREQLAGLQGPAAKQQPDQDRQLTLTANTPFPLGSRSAQPGGHGVPEPRNLRRLKAEVTRRRGMVHLLDILKEADLRVGFTGEFTPVGTREALDRDVLQQRRLWPSARMGPTPVCTGSPRVSTATARTTCATPAAAA